MVVPQNPAYAASMQKRHMAVGGPQGGSEGVGGSNLLNGFSGSGELLVILAKHFAHTATFAPTLALPPCPACCSCTAREKRSRDDVAPRRRLFVVPNPMASRTRAVGPAAAVVADTGDRAEARPRCTHVRRIATHSRAGRTTPRRRPIDVELRLELSPQPATKTRAERKGSSFFRRSAAPQLFGLVHNYTVVGVCVYGKVYEWRSHANIQKVRAQSKSEKGGQRDFPFVPPLLPNPLPNRCCALFS